VVGGRHAGEIPPCAPRPAGLAHGGNRRNGNLSPVRPPRGSAEPTTRARLSPSRRRRRRLSCERACLSLYVNLSINRTIVQSVNQSTSLAFFLSPISLPRSLATFPSIPYLPLLPLKRWLSLHQGNKQAASPFLFLPEPSVISSGFFPFARSGCSASVNRFLHVLVLCRTVPPSFVFSPTKPSLPPRHSFDPTIFFYCIAVSPPTPTTPIAFSTRTFPLPARPSEFLLRLEYFLIRPPPSEA
jgi:hypothetical protein